MTRLIPYLSGAVLLSISVILMSTRFWLFGVPLLFLAVIWVLMVWTVTGAGRSHEVLEVDSRYMTVKRGTTYFVWPTAKVADTLRVAPQPPSRSLQTTLSGASPMLRTGTLEWGEPGTPYYGSFAPDLSSGTASQLESAIKDFLTEHQPVQVNYVPGQDLPLTTQE